ncbi:MAG: UbiA family prenyltransferase [Theionarchaea archaeon]|nr:UbiA family prenyltransferase [Theionarchaea archaeon]
MASSRFFFQKMSSPVSLMIDLRFNYAVISTGLILVGFFWNNLYGFSLEYVMLIVSIFCANVFMFVVNDYYDAVHDALDPVKYERNVFCSSHDSRTGKIILFSSLGLSLLLSFFVSIPIFMIVVFFNLLAISYSAPGIKLRNRIYWDWIFVFLWKGLIIIASYVYFFGMNFSRLTPFMYGTVFIIMLFSWISQLENQIRDFEVDKLSNSNHSAQQLGHKMSSYLQHILLLSFFIFSGVFCLYMDLYITIGLIAASIILYYFVTVIQKPVVMELINIWIVVLFLEHFMDTYNYQQQILFSGWIIAMIMVAIIHVKRNNSFSSDNGIKLPRLSVSTEKEKRKE